MFYISSIFIDLDFQKCPRYLVILVLLINIIPEKCFSSDVDDIER